jgi:ABC-type dipeptide/oligopeptide/nickel transport system, ATPase component
MDKSSSKSKAQISLSVENLITSLTVNGINYRSLDGISLTIKKGEVYGLTGESNSGKTLLAESIMNLIPENKGMVESGNVIFNKINTMYYHTGETRKSLFSIKKGKEVKKKKPKNYDKLMEELRGKRISYLMQDSFHSLNPSMTIGDHMVEVLMRHRIPEIG